MTRLDFLKRALSIPAIAMLFPASPGAVAEPKLIAPNQSVATIDTSQVPIGADYNGAQVTLLIPFRNASFKVGDIITDVKRIGRQYWVTEITDRYDTDITIYRVLSLGKQDSVVAPEREFIRVGEMNR